MDLKNSEIPGVQNQSYLQNLILLDFLGLDVTGLVKLRWVVVLIPSAKYLIPDLAVEVLDHGHRSDEIAFLERDALFLELPDHEVVVVEIYSKRSGQGSCNVMGYLLLMCFS